MKRPDERDLSSRANDASVRQNPSYREWRSPMEFARWIGVSKKHYERKIRPILVAAKVARLPISSTRYKWHVPSAIAALRGHWGMEGDVQGGTQS